MYLTVKTSPPRTMRINPEAVACRLGSLLEAEVRNDLFLEACGITINPGHERLRIRFDPRPTLRIDELAITHLLRRRLNHHIAEDPFLTACNVQLSLPGGTAE